MLPAQHLPYPPSPQVKGTPPPPLRLAPLQRTAVGGLHANRRPPQPNTGRAVSTPCSFLRGARGAWVSCGPPGQGALAVRGGWARDRGAGGAGERRGRVWPRCSGQRAAPWQAAANSQSRGVFPERAAGGYSWVLPDSPCTCRPAPQYAARQGSPLQGSYPTAGFPRAPTGVRCTGDRS